MEEKKASFLGFEEQQSYFLYQQPSFETKPDGECKRQKTPSPEIYCAMRGWGRLLSKKAVHLSAFQTNQKPLMAIAGFLLLSLLFSLWLNVNILFLTLSILYGMMMFLHILALFYMPQKRNVDLSLEDEALPVYTILLPLYQEAHMVEQLSQAIWRLNYPKDKLDVIYLLEHCDTKTLEAVERVLEDKQGLGQCLIVPPSSLKTKPRACNYGLWYAKGELCVIFDSEDIPHKDQLREAANIFAKDTNKHIACLQAPLVIGQTNKDFFATQMALEYVNLFFNILPILERLRMPIPLGGNSNHFRTDVLKTLYGWDGFNVTEDADMGIRLGVYGHQVKLLTHPTFEAGTIGYEATLKQRTRWIKGHIQTWFVHTRNMRHMFGRMSIISWLAFQAIFIIRVFNGLVNLSLLALLIMASHYVIPSHMSLSLFSTFLVISYAIIFMGYYVGCNRANRQELKAHIPYLPLFVLFTSLPCVRALGQLLTKPYIWEKTDHKPLDEFLDESHILGESHILDESHILGKGLDKSLGKSLGKRLSKSVSLFL